MTDRSHMIKVLKLISGVLVLCFWFSCFLVWKYFDTHESNIAVPNRGRIYPLNTHGSIVYLTQGEIYALYGLMAAGAAFFVVAIVFHVTETKRL